MSDATNKLIDLLRVVHALQGSILKQIDTNAFDPHNPDIWYNNGLRTRVKSIRDAVDKVVTAHNEFEASLEKAQADVGLRPVVHPTGGTVKSFVVVAVKEDSKSEFAGSTYLYEIVDELTVRREGNTVEDVRETIECINEAEKIFKVVVQAAWKPDGGMLHGIIDGKEIHAPTGEDILFNPVVTVWQKQNALEIANRLLLDFYHQNTAGEEVIMRACGLMQRPVTQ